MSLKAKAQITSLPPRDPDGPLRGKKLRAHNERVYRSKGWVKGADGVWRPPRTTPRRPPNGGSVA